MQDDNYQADLIARNYDRAIESKRKDSRIIEIGLGVIGAFVFVAIVMLIWVCV